MKRLKSIGIGRSLNTRTVQVNACIFSLVCFICLGIQPVLAAPADDFVTTWKTDNPGTSNFTSITVPMVGGPYDVDWNNDGTFDEFGLNDSVVHDYGVVGTYTIRIRGEYESICTCNVADKEKFLSIDQWGTQSWASMSDAFSGAKNLTIPATDTPNFSAVTTMSWMFSGATSANPDTSGWDTSSVTNMSEMFSGATSANPDTSGWDTGAVIYMAWMFSGATSANPDTSGWDTSSVTNMAWMFSGATSSNPDTSGWGTSSVTRMAGMFSNNALANPDTSEWDTSSVTMMDWMFSGATSANPDTSGWDTSLVFNMAGMFSNNDLANPDTSEWDTSSVISMSEMFSGATSANPDTGGWDTSVVADMRDMFRGATSFDQDIGSWDVTSLKLAWNMFTGVTLSTANYESLLTGWNAQTLQSGVEFDGGNSTYCSALAIAARANMIAADSWVITDGGQQACPPPGNEDCDEAFVQLDNQTLVLNVAPTGVDDTVNIQCALDTAVETGIPTVRLGNSTYYIGNLMVENFRGSFDGRTQSTTFLEVIDGSVSCGTMNDLGRESAAIKFVKGEPRIRFMTIRADQPCMSDEMIESIVHFTGESSLSADCANDVIFGAVDRVGVEGSENTLTGQTKAILVSAEGNQLGGCKQTLLGTFKLNRSNVSSFFTGVQTAMRGGAQVDINFNNFEGNQNSVWLYNTNQNTTITANKFNSVDVSSSSVKGVVIRTQTLDAPAITRVVINNNEFTHSSSTGGLNYAIDGEQPGRVANVSAVITNNKFYLSGDSTRGISLNDISNAHVSANRFTGDGEIAVYVSGTTPVSGWTITANKGMGTFSSADSDVVLDQNTAECIVGTDQGALVDDSGSDNTVLPQF